jgi:hypothetical protein
MTYSPREPVTDGLADLMDFCADRQWGLFFARLEILAQEKAIINAGDSSEADRAANSVHHLMSLITPLFEGGEIPEVVHQLVRARAAQIAVELT